MADISTFKEGGRVTGKMGKTAFTGVITKVLLKKGELKVRTADGENITVAADKVTKARGRPPAAGKMAKTTKAAKTGKTEKKNTKASAKATAKASPKKAKAKAKAKAENNRDEMDDMLELAIATIRVVSPSVMKDALEVFEESESSDDDYDEDNYDSDEDDSDEDDSDEDDSDEDDSDEDDSDEDEDEDE
jgi:hypothetical protein